jgi:hypothetical protein
VGRYVVCKLICISPPFLITGLIPVADCKCNLGNRPSSQIHFHICRVPCTSRTQHARSPASSATS